MSPQTPPEKIDEAYLRCLSEGPQTALEKRYINEFLESRGYHWDHLHELPEKQVKELMQSACRYASLKLAEVEARRQFKDEIKFES